MQGFIAWFENIFDKRNGLRVKTSWRSPGYETQRKLYFDFYRMSCYTRNICLNIQSQNKTFCHYCTV